VRRSALAPPAWIPEARPRIDGDIADFQTLKYDSCIPHRSTPAPAAIGASTTNQLHNIPLNCEFLRK